jgi:hypothetical protein
MLVSRAGLHFHIRVAETCQTYIQHQVLRFGSQFVELGK